MANSCLGVNRRHPVFELHLALESEGNLTSSASISEHSVALISA